MPRFSLAGRLVACLSLLLLFLAACSPSLNWRELTLEPTALKLMLPCKPDKAERRIEMLPGRDVVVHAIGCEAGGASYAVLYADLNNAAELDAAIDRWKGASLASIKGVVKTENKALPPGAMGLRNSTLVLARGTRADGRSVESEASYFAQGTLVYQAAIYSERITPEIAEPFFAGLRFQ